MFTQKKYAVLFSIFILNLLFFAKFKVSAIQIPKFKGVEANSHQGTLLQKILINIEKVKIPFGKKTCPYYEAHIYQDKVKLDKEKLELIEKILDFLAIKKSNRADSSRQLSSKLFLLSEDAIFNRIVELIPEQAKYLKALLSELREAYTLNKVEVKTFFKNFIQLTKSESKTQIKKNKNVFQLTESFMSITSDANGIHLEVNKLLDLQKVEEAIVSLRKNMNGKSSFIDIIVLETIQSFLAKYAAYHTNVFKYLYHSVHWTQKCTKNTPTLSEGNGKITKEAANHQKDAITVNGRRITIHNHDFESTEGELVTAKEI